MGLVLKPCQIWLFLVASPRWCYVGNLNSTG
jgi:hypothetical protein